MTDPTSKAGDPVEEPRTGDTDVVGRANEGLAEAEAAVRDVETDAPSEAVVTEAVVAETVTVDEVDGVIVAEETVVVETVGDEIPWYDRPDDVPFDDGPAVADAAPTAAAASAAEAEWPAPAPLVTASEPTPEPDVLAPGLVAASAQPIFVQAPEPPRPRGNRGAAGAIGLVATLAFAAAYFVVYIVIALIVGAADFASFGTVALQILATPDYWTPVATFFVAFWILGAFINRGRWGHWVVWGLLVGVASYGGYLLGRLFEAPFWTLSARQAGDLVTASLFVPLAIAAFVIGRELTIWFGAWVARRGRRITELNAEAHREYERTLEAGPQLHQV